LIRADNVNMPKLPRAVLSSADDAEQQFYDALQNADIERFMAVWSDEDDIACVHPGGPRLIGIDAIRESFEAMFSQGAVDARPERVRRVQTHFGAVHSVLERVSVMSDQGPQVAWVIATNVYISTPLGWRIVAHHASPGTAREAQEIVEPSAVLH
jgi:ketosteroid isomerase-like protein